jgi:hypothetical protein
MIIRATIDIKYDFDATEVHSIDVIEGNSFVQFITQLVLFLTRVQNTYHERKLAERGKFDDDIPF